MSLTRGLRLLTAVGLVLALHGTAFGQVPPPPPPPPPPAGPGMPAPSRDFSAPATGTASLGGVVVAADGSNRPVRRVTITARGSALPSGRLVLTDDQGRFLIADLPAGSYSLSYSKPGWVYGYYGARDPWKSPGTPLVLADGERRNDLVLPLPPGAVITGRILDQFGQPQAGARVLAMERRRSGGRDTFTPARTSSSISQTTDDRGVFRIYGLPPGEFVVGANITGGPRSTTNLTTPEEVRWAEQLSRSGLTGAGQPPPEGPAVAYSPVYYPGVTDAAAAAPVAVGMGEVRSGIDFQLQFVPTATVSGTLQMSGGPVPRGVTLMMTGAGDGGGITTSLLSGLSINRASVGRDGGFSFQSVTPGDYLLSARASSQPPAARGRGAGPGGPPVMDLWASQQITVNGRDVEGIMLQLQPGLTMTGRVTFDPTVLEPPDDLQRVQIRLMPAEQNVASVGVSPTEVKPDGTFTIAGIVPGRYVLAAGAPRGSGPPGVTWTAHRADINGRNGVETPFDVTPGLALDNVVVEFTDRAAELSGQVTDANGRPVTGLTMILFTANADSWGLSIVARSLRTAPLDSDGRYRMPSMAAGEYYLAALAELDQADLSDPAFLEQVAALAIKVTLTLGEKTVQDIKLGGAGGA